MYARRKKTFFGSQCGDNIEKSGNFPVPSVPEREEHPEW
jgi:hypothetical protein